MSNDYFSYTLNIWWNDVKVSVVYIPIFSQENVLCIKYWLYNVCLLEIWKLLP